MAEGARRGTASVCSETLGPGDWFGGLWTDAPTGLTLASRGAGRLALIRASRLRALQGDWPDLLQAFARDGERRQIALAKGLLADRENSPTLTACCPASIRLPTSWCRAAWVAERWWSGSSANSASPRCLTCRPNEAKSSKPISGRGWCGRRSHPACHEREGGVGRAHPAPQRGAKLGRIRRKAQRKGLQRLLAQIDGRVIRKTRLTLRDHPTLAIDVFKEPEAGLVILERPSPMPPRPGPSRPDEVAPLVTEEVTRQSQYSNRAMANSAGQKSIATNPVS